MPRRPPRTHQPAPTPGPAGRPAEEQLARWAELIAAGRAELPAGLSPAEAGRLGQEVRERRRARLVRWIARAVARDLRRGPGPGSGD